MEGTKIESGDKLKLLGHHFSNKPNCSAHIESIRKNVRGKYWLLLHLRRNGFDADDLLKVYKTIVRPSAEYCAPAFHSMMTDRQDQQVERLQATAFYGTYMGLAHRTGSSWSYLGCPRLGRGGSLYVTNLPRSAWETGGFVDGFLKLGNTGGQDTHYSMQKRMRGVSA